MAVPASQAGPQAFQRGLREQQLPGFVRLPLFVAANEPSLVQVAGQAQQGFRLSLSGLTVLLQLSTFSLFLLGSSQTLWEMCYLFLTGGEAEAQRLI